MPVSNLAAPIVVEWVDPLLSGVQAIEKQS